MYQNSFSALQGLVAFFVSMVNVMIERSYLVMNTTLKVKTWNIQPSFTCPGKTRWCKRNCYACKGQYVFPSVQEAMAWRTLETLGSHFVSSMVAECKRLRNKVVRVHSAGDFYSVEYLQKWIDIAKACPEVTFFTYTRTWHIPSFLPKLQEFASLPNVTLWFSVDPSDKHVPEWDNIARIEGSIGAGEVSCKKQLTEGESCKTCEMCFDGSHNDVVFHVH